MSVLDEPFAGDKQYAVDKLNEYVGKMSQALNMPASEVVLVLLAVTVVWASAAHDRARPTTEDIG